MIGVAQTIAGGPNAEPAKRGNCIAACVASLLELPIDRVPNFVAHDDYWERIQAFLEPFGLAMWNFEPEAGEERWHPEGYWIAGVPSLNIPDATHAVVMLDDELVWDPNPPSSKRYETVDLAAVDSMKVFVARDPALARKAAA